MAKGGAKILALSDSIGIEGKVVVGPDSMITTHQHEMLLGRTGKDGTSAIQDPRNYDHNFSRMEDSLLL